MALIYFQASHMLTNSICDIFLFSIFFILVLYRSSLLIILWILVLKTWSYKYENDKTQKKENCHKCYYLTCVRAGKKIDIILACF